MKDDLYTLEGLKPGSEEFDNLMTRMMDSLRHHNDSEETKDLPMLEPAIGKAMSIETAASFKITKKFVPTRLVVLLVAVCPNVDNVLQVAPLCAQPAPIRNPSWFYNRTTR